MEVVREYVPVIVNIDAVQKNVNDLFLIIQIIRVAVLELTDPFNNLLLRVRSQAEAGEKSAGAKGTEVKPAGSRNCFTSLF